MLTKAFLPSLGWTAWRKGAHEKKRVKHADIVEECCSAMYCRVQRVGQAVPLQGLKNAGHHRGHWEKESSGWSVTQLELDQKKSFVGRLCYLDLIE